MNPTIASSRGRSGTASSHWLYLSVLAAIVAAALLGTLAPQTAIACKPLGDGFVKLVKMLIAPIVFVTVVVGIGRVSDGAAVGRIGLKAIVYFEFMTTLAMLIGLAVGHLVRPGTGLHIAVATLDPSKVSTLAKPKTVVEFLLGIIPDSVVGAFTGSDILPVLFFAVLFGFAVSRLGARGQTLVAVIDEGGAALFRVIGMIMWVAPLGAFGGMAFTVGQYGIGSLANLGLLMLCFYLTCAVFVLGLLTLVLGAVGLNLFALLRYLADEFFIVLGTSSSEAALPQLIEKLERLGVPRPLVGLVVPLGYAFNLDGTSIYFTMAIAFIAQALDIPLSFGDWVMLLGVLLLTSKGAAAVTGGGLITLAATLTTLDGKVPVAGIVLVFAIDRFMSEARAITNLFGNAVATLVVARWEGALDGGAARAVIADRTVAAIAE